MAVHAKRSKASTNRNKIFIIAEAGVNHNGSLLTAKKMVDAAARAGADAVKFQTFSATALVSRKAPKAAYQRLNTGANETQFEMLRRLELGESAQRELRNYCRQRRILFLSSPFDLAGIDFLAHDLRLKTFKIPSGEITNLPYLRKIGALNVRIIMSTGMADEWEIAKALKMLVLSGSSKTNIVLLHCTSEYPTPFARVNLRAMQTLKSRFHVEVGFSDHTRGIEASIAAAALGASIIEKHFTLDRKMQGPDHQASIEPHELAALVQSVRNIEKALGTGEKKPTPVEMKNRMVVRKSIVAARVIHKGEVFVENALAVKRPGNGLDPMEWDRVVGKIAQKDFIPDELISL